MTRRSYATEIREQSSVSYISPGRADEIPQSFAEFYTHMFLDDVSQALLPIWATRPNSNVSVEITPANADLEDMLSAGLDTSRQSSYQRDLGSALSQFLRLTMVELCIARRAVFEIAYLRPNPEEPRDGFHLVHVNPRQIVHRWGRWHQIVPPDVAREKKVAEKIPISCENIAAFTLPRHLARPVASAMDALSALSDHRWLDLALQAQNQQLPYDFSAHARSMRIALAESVREIGWAARGSFNDKVTSYYSLRQHLRFKLFVVEIREALLAQLNAVLQRIGSVLGWSAQLSISALPTRSSLEEALAQLASGEKPFTEILNAVRVV